MARSSRKSPYAEKWQDVMSYAATATPSVLGCACVDLDSVILFHDTAWGNSRLGPVLPRGRELCQLLYDRKFRVIVLTARPIEQHSNIAWHLKNHDVRFHDVTNFKPPADFYFDDKAVRTPKNWK